MTGVGDQIFHNGPRVKRNVYNPMTAAAFNTSSAPAGVPNLWNTGTFQRSEIAARPQNKACDPANHPYPSAAELTSSNMNK